MASATRLSPSLRETTKNGRPGLLVSVRNVAEARAAYEGGAAVIDIKEPRNGALGAASRATIAQIVAFIDGRRPVTAALGELGAMDDVRGFPGVAAVKVGLAGLGKSDWRERLTDFAQQVPVENELVPAAYADWRAAGAPEPPAVLEAAAELRLSWLLLDTWDKSSGDLLEHCSESDLQALLAVARRQGLQMVLAGRLRGDSLRRVGQLGPDLVGVRSAVCVGGRDGHVGASLVELAAKSILGQDQPFPVILAGNRSPNQPSPK